MELWHSKYDKETDTLYGIHTAGFYSCINCVRMSLYKLISNNIFTKNISFINTLHRYKDSPDIDLYKALYTINEEFKKDILIKNFDMFCATNTDHKNIDFNFTVPIDKTYFSPSLLVENRTKKLIEDYKIDAKNTVAVLHRGTDKWKEASLLPLNKWIDVIEDNVTDSDRIFIQTDDEVFLNGFLEYFGDRCFYIKENVFGIDNTANVVPLFKKTEWAVTFESIMRIISKSRKIINHTGNCALIPILYRGSYDGEVQFFNKEIIDYDKLS